MTLRLRNCMGRLAYVVRHFGRFLAIGKGCVDFSTRLWIAWVESWGIIRGR